MGVKGKPAASIRPPPPLSPVPALPPADVERFIREGQTSGDVSKHPETSRNIPRARRGSKKILTRSDGRECRRTTIYLTPATAEALEAHCKAEGREMSRVIEEAVKAHLARAKR